MVSGIEFVIQLALNLLPGFCLKLSRSGVSGCFMKVVTGIGAWVVALHFCHAASLPVVTSHPQNQTVVPATNVSFSVAATGATVYQWRFNGTDLAGEMGSSLTLTNVQFTNAGYYLAIAKNSSGWVPSQMAYLSVVDTAGSVPFTTQGNTNAVARYPYPNSALITNGTARLVAGPALDQMQIVGASASVFNGYFIGGTRQVPTVAAGKEVYYRVDISYPYPSAPSGVYTQQSTVIKLVADVPEFPPVSPTNLYFPGWIEWPEPIFYPAESSPTNQVRVPGETFAMSNRFLGYNDLRNPAYQWRKDGRLIGVPVVTPYIAAFTNIFLRLTNLQSSDAGIYDVMVLGNNWFIAPKITLSVQLSNGPGLFQNPRNDGSGFVSELIGVAGRAYRIQVSSNLATWTDLLTLTNVSGSVTLSNGLPNATARFYRAFLIP